MAKKKETKKEPAKPKTMTKEESVNKMEFDAWARAYRRDVAVNGDNHNPDFHPDGSVCVRCYPELPTMNELWLTRT